MKEYQTTFIENRDGICISSCPFGFDARVGSADCEYKCKCFIKRVYWTRENRNDPISGTIYCSGKPNKQSVV